MPDAANIDYYDRFGALGILMFVALPPGYKWGAALNIMLMPRPITPFGPSLSPWPAEIMARLKSRSRRLHHFGSPLGLGQQVSGEGQIRISIQTMSGSCSEYVA